MRTTKTKRKKLASDFIGDDIQITPYLFALRERSILTIFMTLQFMQFANLSGEKVELVKWVRFLWH